MGHSHAHPSGPGTSSQRGRVLLAAILVPCLLAVVAGLVLLWPGDVRTSDATRDVVPAEVVDAEVTAVRVAPCGSLAEEEAGATGAQQCLLATFALQGGPDEGTEQQLEIDPSAGQPEVAVGDDVRLSLYVDAVGTTTYAFTDFQRGRPLLLLGLLTAAVVVAVARWRGLAAVLGIGVAGVGLIAFVLPALLDGKPPLLVALTAAGALLPLLLYLAHGPSARTSAALAGTLLSLALCAVLSVLAVEAARLTGLSSDDAVALQGFDRDLDVTQLLICGFVIGALGALNDVTITQASAVWELSAGGAGVRESYARAMRIGRDHIASSVYTLVFAYAGTALPLLLVFVVLDRPALDVVGSDLIAVEVVRTLVGTLGLVASVPITTALAALAAGGPAPAGEARHLASPSPA